MTATTRGTAATDSEGAERLRGVRQNLVPVAAVALVLVAVVAGWLIVGRIGLLLGWDATYSGAGTFTVVSCEPQAVFGPDRWRCQGRLTTPTMSDQGAELLVGKDARLSSRPYVGQQVGVLYDPAAVDGDAAPMEVYARDAQLTELTRLYLLLPALMMIFIGATGSVVGLALDWLAGRSSNATSWWRTSPLLGDLRRRGMIWLAAGLGAFVLHQVLVRYLLGSAGVG